MSMTIFDSHCHGNAAADLRSPAVAKKRVREPRFIEFGKRLKHWRGAMQIETVVRLVREMNVEFDDSTLRMWEYGWVGSPDPVRLLALASVLKVSNAEVLQALTNSRGAHANKAIKIPAPRAAASIVKPLKQTNKGAVRVNFLEDPIAAGPPLIVRDSEVLGTIPFDADWLHKLGVGKPVCVKVGDFEQSMMPTIRPGEVVLIDLARRADLENDRIYAVTIPGVGSTLKRIVLTPDAVLLVSDNPDKNRYKTVMFPRTDNDFEELLIVGQMVWHGDKAFL